LFLAELKRRKVYRVAVVYVLAGVALIEAADLILPRLLLPPWTVTLVVVLVLLGFPVGLILSWAFQITPEEPELLRPELAKPELAKSELPGKSPPRTRAEDGEPAGTAPQPEVLSLPKGPVIAVLPFDNMSGNPEDEFFTDGITEDLIAGLTRFTHLFVIARNSTQQFKGTGVDVREVGRIFGASYVLEGGIRKSASHLRVSAQLIDAKTGTHLWAETYDRDLTAGEVFAVQDDITDCVVATLAGPEGVLARSGASKTKRKPTENLDAYEAVLRAFSYWDRQTPQEHLEVRQALETAVELDPEYAHAWACLAVTYLDEFRVQFNPLPQPLERALDAARRAVELDPASHLSQQALAQAHFYRGEVDAFSIAAEKAVRLNPNDCTIVAMMGLLKAYTGAWDSGLALIEKAMTLNPYHPGWYYLPLAINDYRKGEYEAALEKALKAGMPGYYPTHVVRATIYGQLGRRAEAQAAVEALLRLFPNFGAVAREELGKWILLPDVLDHMMEGLEKAGVRI
jgi:TolB-like protein/Tfp pilus assembly protein PilF